MKYLLKISFVVFIGLTCVSCSDNNNSSGAEEVARFDLSNLELDGILDYNTKITKGSIDTEAATEIINNVINEAYLIDGKTSVKDVVLKFYFKKDILYVAFKDYITHEDTNAGGEEPDSTGWKHCKKCRSKDCVADFIKEMGELYDCFEVRIEKYAFSAMVYAKPCS